MFDRLPSNVYLQLLGKITLYTKGIEVGSSAYTESGIPFLRVSNLSKHGIVDDSVNFISDELYNVLREKYEPQQGEILLSKDATPGIAYFLDESVKGLLQVEFCGFPLLKIYHHTTLSSYLTLYLFNYKLNKVLVVQL